MATRTGLPDRLWAVSLGLAACVLSSAVSQPDNRPTIQLPRVIAAASGQVTMEAGGRPLAEVLKAVSSQVGLNLSAGQDLTAEKVTVHFRGLATPDALRALAAAVDGEWKDRPQTNAGKPVYRIEPTKRRRARLAQYRRARQAAVEACNRAALADLLRNLSAQQPGPKGAPGVEVPLFLRPKPIFGIVRSLPPESLRLLVVQANDSFPIHNGVSPAPTPILTLPGGALSQQQKAALAGFLEQLANESAGKGEGGLRRSQELRAEMNNLDGFLLDFWSFRTQARSGVGVEILLRLRASGDRWGSDLKLGTARGHSIEDGLEGVASLAPREATLADGPREAAPLKLEYGQARGDRGLIEAARINLAADYYTRPGVLSASGNLRSLRSLIGEAEKTHNLAHFWLGKTLVARSRDWAAACDREPPARVTDYLDAQFLAKKGTFGLTEYLFAVTSLSDPRIPTLFCHADERGTARYFRDVSLMARYRHVLRGYSSLDAPQRRRLSAGSGLPLASLSPAQLERWGPALRRFSLLPPSAFDRATLRTTAGTVGVLPDFMLVGLTGMPPVQLAGNGRPR